MQLRVTVDEGSERTTIALAGELDVAVVGQFLDETSTACRDGRTVVVDLSLLTFADSSGLAAMVKLKKQCASAGGRMRVTEVPDRLERVLELTGLGDYLRS